MKIITTYATGVNPQEFLREHIALITEAQGFAPFGRVRSSGLRGEPLCFEIQEVTDEAVELLDYEYDWSVRDDGGSWGITHKDAHLNSTLVKGGLFRSEAVELARLLNKHEDAIAKELDDNYDMSRFFITELY